MTIYSLLLFIIIFIALRYLSPKKNLIFGDWTYSFVFLIKVFAGISFLLLYTYFYGSGSLNSDAYFFFHDSKELNHVFYTSRIDYFKLLINYGDISELTQKHLLDTTLWDTSTSRLINDNRLLIRIHSIIHFFSHNDVNIHLVIICLISTISFYQFYATIQPYTLYAKKTAFLLILFLPSVLFWTSTMLKEPFLFLGIAFFLRAMIYKISTKKRVIFISISIFLLVGIKTYILLFIVLTIPFYFIYLKLPRYKLLGTLSIFSSIVIFLILFAPNYTTKVTHVISRKQFDFINVGRGGIHAITKDGFYYFSPSQINDLNIENDSVSLKKPLDAFFIKRGSMEKPTPIHLESIKEKWSIYFYNKQSRGYIETTKINDSFSQLIYNIPEALFNSLFRPLPNDPGSWLKYLAFFETSVLFFLLIFSIYHRKKLSNKEKAMVFSISLFIFFLSLLIGWTTPVLGAIVRYRIPAYLGILFIALIIYSPSKISK